MASHDSAASMPQPATSLRQVVTYLLLVLAFSSVFYALIICSHTLAAGAGMYVLGIMWCPALAAFLTLKINHRSLAELGWRWPQARFAAVSWFLPLAYAAIAYAMVWLCGLGAFPNPDFMQQLVAPMGLRTSPTISTILYVLLMGSIGLVRSLSSALGEEIGWRGFLVPELFKTMGFAGTALISGLTWACWHYPGLIWSDYNAGTPTWYGFTCFTVMVVAIPFVFAWMRLRSGSLWTGALLHASHNLYVQAIFTPLTGNTGKTAWFIDEFGAVLPVMAVLVAIYFWRRRGELTAPPLHPCPR
jgi:membrane protease YdiL (CAAX protease family)